MATNAKRANTKVYVTVREAGVAFGCIGQIRSAANGRVLREAKHVRPLGFTSAARTDALELAEALGYDVDHDRKDWRHS